MRPTLDDVMSGRATITPRQIEATADEPVLAIDIVGSYGAAFRFSVDDRGEAFSDTLYARLVDGAWDEMGSGGSRGGWWDLPWQPPREGWNGYLVMALGTVGLDVEVDGEDVPLYATYGFAAPSVKQLVVKGSAVRTIPVTSPVGAFVVVTIGDEEFEIAPADADGSILGRSYERTSDNPRHGRGAASEFHIEGL